tara:strand:- start:3012 stop:3803 length:792 start_codon:yes stop_codon:yes gene_type:complete
MNFNLLVKKYWENGFISNVPIISNNEAKKHRKFLEEAEKKVGSLHYKTKVHTILTSPYQLATNNKILDIVELLIGPNILLHNVTYIIKEPQSLSHVSWHQDLTYWGFSNDKQVSVWLALSPANKLSGCMQMIPKSHNWGKLKHVDTEDSNNVLSSGQTVNNIDESKSIYCDLKCGEASFHHGWILHKSNKNLSNDRRIGLNMQFLSTDVKQLKHNFDSAICVRGVDKFKNFSEDIPAKKNLDKEALKKFYKIIEIYKKTQKMH